MQVADNGDSGLQMIRKIEPDVILIDLKMPGMSGMEILKKASEIAPHIVSVVITGYGTVELAVEAMKLNAYDILTKPFTPDQLRMVTREALKRRRSFLESERLQQEREKSKENFVTLVSHQLRSPLVSVKQDFEAVLGGFTGEMNRVQKQMLEQADKRIEELIETTNDLLNIARIETGKVIENPVSIALPAVITEVMEFLKPLAAEKHITLKIDFPDNLPEIKGSREGLKQMFLNLISNGIIYNKKGGTLAVRAREKEKNVLVEIVDTGIGISQDRLPLIFDEFFRVKTKETQGIIGTGLGLPIAKRIAEVHHGTIEVTSETGKGSAFTVSLPEKVNFAQVVKRPVLRVPEIVEINDIAGRLGLKNLTPDIQPRSMSGSCVYGLLSDVLVHARPEALFVTIQTHMAVIAVAVRKKVAAVVFASGRVPDDIIIEKAIKEHVALYVSELSVFEIVWQFYELVFRG